MTNKALKIVEDTKMDNDKSKALEAALGQIEKSYGKGSIMRLGAEQSLDIEEISTGSLSLDIALALVAYKRAGGNYGPESSGKHWHYNVCRMSKIWWYGGIYRCRTALDPVYAKKLSGIMMLIDFPT